MQIRDHNGNEFNSLAEMCEYWGISLKAYKYRIEHGWTLKLALETSTNHSCKDHLGKTFSSIKEMLAFYGLARKRYEQRLAYGWSLEKTLTTPVRSRKCSVESSNDKEEVVQLSEISNPKSVPKVYGECVHSDTDIKTVNKYIGITDDKLMYALAVADKCYALSLEYGYEEMFACKMYAVGFIHSIGYAFSESEDDYLDVGAGLLTELGVSELITSAIRNCNKVPAAVTSEWRVLATAIVTLDTNGSYIDIKDKLFDTLDRYGMESAQFSDMYNLCKVLGLIGKGDSAKGI